MKVEVEIQDISTAPKDRAILVLDEGLNRVAFWDDQHGPNPCWRDDRGYRLWRVTKWCELPIPTEVPK